MKDPSLYLTVLNLCSDILRCIEEHESKEKMASTLWVCKVILKLNPVPGHIYTVEQNDYN